MPHSPPCPPAVRRVSVAPNPAGMGSPLRTQPLRHRPGGSPAPCGKHRREARGSAEAAPSPGAHLLTTSGTPRKALAAAVSDPGPPRDLPTQLARQEASARRTEVLLRLGVFPGDAAESGNNAAAVHLLHHPLPQVPAPTFSFRSDLLLANPAARGFPDHGTRHLPGDSTLDGCHKTKPTSQRSRKKPKSSPLAMSNTDGQKRVVILWSNVKTHLFRLLCRAHNRTQLRIHGMHILTAYKRSSSNGCLHRQRMYRHVKPGGLHWKITWRYSRVTTATRNRSKPIKLGKYLLLFLFTQAGGRVRFPPLRHLWAKPKGPPTACGGLHSL